MDGPDLGAKAKGRAVVSRAGGLQSELSVDLC